MTNITRKFVSTNAVNVEADGSFSGYASVFDVVDLGEEQVAPGAFKDCLKAKGAKGIRMLFQHDPDAPIGHWTRVEEDRYGLAVSGVIDTNIEKGREVLSMLRTGALDGLSIGFKAVETNADPHSGVRRIIKADLWEISIVTFPMLPQARVHDVKSSGRWPSKRTFERWLVRDAGFTRRQAHTIIAKGYNGLCTARDAGSSATTAEAANAANADLAKVIYRAASKLTS
ncbi:MAG: HK97 family phage prohead protease [Pseudomonadota bacterium]